MKRRIVIIMVALCSMMSCNDGVWDAIHGLEDKYNDLDGRLSKLEELCKEMNTNISALQTLVSVMLNNDYIVSIVPIMKENQEIGYTITFAIHDPITIYHGQNGQNGKDGQDGKDGENGKDGQDGKDGQNGKDGQDGKDGNDGAKGQDGTTPIIGVALDSSDNAYYWTLNGDWLLDAQGNRIPLTSRDGKDGENGKDGKDGITPQLKIEENYWYVSTDNGQTWTKLGKAVGEDGKDGEKGEKGDYFFDEIITDSQYVYFVLRNGTILKVLRAPKEEKVQIVDGAIMAPFSVSETKMVYFSMGNLQYSKNGTHLCLDGTTKSGTWKFAESQAEISNDSLKMTFKWGSSGYSETSETLKADITSTNYDWGTYNAISNGENIPGKWRVLTRTEMNYLLTQRTNANKLYKRVTVNDQSGLLILPDDWVDNIGEIPTEFYTGYQLYCNSFDKIEALGAIFISSIWLGTYSTSYSEAVVFEVTSNGYQFNNYQQTKLFRIRLVTDIK